VTGGMGGTPMGGSGGVGGVPTFCPPGDVVSCYEGPAGTAGVGQCSEGTSECLADGSAYGPCTGQVLPASEDPNAPGDEECDGVASGEVVSERVAGDAGGDRVVDVARDSADNLVVVGTFTTTIDLGGGPLVSAGLGDIFLAKYDSSGNHLWSKRFGDNKDQSVAAVAVDSTGSILLTGAFKGTISFGVLGLPAVGAGYDIYLAKFDGLGAHVASKRLTSGSLAGGLPTGSKWPRDLAVGFGDRIAVGGTFDGHWGGCTSDCDDGAEHGFVRTYDSGLNLLAKKTIGGAAFVNAVSFDATTGVYAGGGFHGTVALGGGVSVATASINNQGFVARLDASLGGVWARSFQGDINSAAQAVTALTHVAGGGVAVAGRGMGAVDFGLGGIAATMPLFVAKYDDTGTLAWGNLYDAPDGTVALQPWRTTIVEDAGGDLYFNASVNGSYTIGGHTYVGGLLQGLVVKVGAGGALEWSRGLGGSSDVLANALCLGPAGTIALVGQYGGTVDFGLGPHTAVASYDAFIVALQR
jgi:hypothetical protein